MVARRTGGTARRPGLVCRDERLIHRRPQLNDLGIGAFFSAIAQILSITAPIRFGTGDILSGVAQILSNYTPIKCIARDILSGIAQILSNATPIWCGAGDIFSIAECRHGIHGAGADIPARGSSLCLRRDSVLVLRPLPHDPQQRERARNEDRAEEDQLQVALDPRQVAEQVAEQREARSEERRVGKECRP